MSGRKTNPLGPEAINASFDSYSKCTDIAVMTDFILPTHQKGRFTVHVEKGVI